MRLRLSPVRSSLALDSFSLSSLSCDCIYCIRNKRKYFIIKTNKEAQWKFNEIKLLTLSNRQWGISFQCESWTSYQFNKWKARKNSVTHLLCQLSLFIFLKKLFHIHFIVYMVVSWNFFFRVTNAWPINP